MRFEYNGNLLERDRVNLVAKEILEVYPDINIEQAKDIALLEGRISENKKVSDELNRLYNIMLVCKNDKNILLTVYKDFLNLLNNNKIEDNIYRALADGIDNYIKGYNEFPMISDYQ